MEDHCPIQGEEQKKKGQIPGFVGEDLFGQ